MLPIVFKINKSSQRLMYLPLQVCQYRCIVSYETPKFEQFALCILQLHNCRGLDAQMPMVPNPAPMTTWRGAPLTHEVAESLFIGWKETGPQMPEGGATKAYSWLVAAGKNPAYDYFPCQVSALSSDTPLQGSCALSLIHLQLFLACHTQLCLVA